MIFTQQQIQQILKIVDKNTILYGAINVGTDVLSEYDKFVLESFGIDIKTLQKDFPLFQQPFYFGRLTQILGDKNAKQLNYDDLLSYLRKGQYHPLNNLEKDMLEGAKIRSYSHIKGLGEKQKGSIVNAIGEEDQRKRSKYEKVIREEVERGIKDRDSLANIVSNIGKRTGDWQRDMGRIVDTEMNNIMQEGRAAQVKREKGKEARVYKDVYEKACRFCIKFYLTNGIGSQPKIFKLSELEANGTNIGKKQADWVPTLGGVHPWCRCNLYNLLPGQEWDEERGEFRYPGKIEEKVEITKKDKIIVGDKVFYV
jgi:hypothetical protein